MKYSKKQYNYYSDDERMSYIREYLSSPESILALPFGLLLRHYWKYNQSSQKI